MNTIDIRRKTIVWLLCGAGLGCGPRLNPPPRAAPEGTTPSPRIDRSELLYEGANRRFALADFYKPDPAQESHPLFALAPLIVVERTAPDTGPGRLSSEDTSPPPLFFAEAEVHFGPVLRRQVIFQCQWPTGHGQTRSDSSSGAVVNPTTVRFTLSEIGSPMIVELLPRGSSDSTIPLVIFVSRALEVASRKQFGMPLPHRRHACEPPINSVPELDVAGMFEDPPVVSGPYLYFADMGQSLTTVLCRCSPSQVGDFDTNQYYRLAPLTKDAFLGSGLSFPDPSPLTELLRLPDALP